MTEKAIGKRINASPYPKTGSYLKKGVVARLPEGYTAHFRDPKVWKKDGAYYMVLGAQTEKLTGSAVLFTSENLTDWTFLGAIAGRTPAVSGHSVICGNVPTCFPLTEPTSLLVCPQGLEADGIEYHNSHQAGYFLGRSHTEPPEFKHGAFTELDRGFDFYAAQTLEDDKGRRILFAWMGFRISMRTNIRHMRITGFTA